MYLNFEDDRLLPTKTDEFDLILRAQEELYPDFASVDVVEAWRYLAAK